MHPLAPTYTHRIERTYADARTVHGRRARGMLSSRGARSGSCGPLITIRPVSGPGLASSSIQHQHLPSNTNTCRLAPSNTLHPAPLHPAVGGVRLQALLACGACWLRQRDIPCLSAPASAAAAAEERRAALRHPVREAVCRAHALALFPPVAPQWCQSCARSARRCWHIAGGGVER